MKGYLSKLKMKQDLILHKNSGAVWSDSRFKEWQGTWPMKTWWKANDVLKNTPKKTEKNTNRNEYQCVECCVINLKKTTVIKIHSGLAAEY